MNLRTEQWITGGLAIVGALNWGLVGLFGFNLVHALFGWSRPIERMIYATVGLAGAWFAFSITQPTGMPSEIRAKIEERRPAGVP